MFVEWCVLIRLQVSREERTFRVNMFVEWCVLIRLQVSREERTFQVNMSVEWCVSGCISGEARGAFAPPPLEFYLSPLMI